MAPFAVPVLKFVGTISLGLLTGTSYTTLITPSSLTLPTAPLALHSATTTSTALSLNLNILSSLAASAYTLAYLLSPRRSGGRHPYLLWTSAVVATSALTDALLDWRAEQRGVGLRALSGKNGREEEEFVDVKGGSGIIGQGVNGEEVKKGVESWRARMLVRTVIAGLGFAMGVVGIWGDGAKAIAAAQTTVAAQ